jgi:hypothetical protein
MPPVGFEPTISAGERPQTYALDRLKALVDLLKIYSTMYSVYKTTFYWLHETFRLLIPGTSGGPLLGAYSGHAGVCALLNAACNSELLIWHSL